MSGQLTEFYEAALAFSKEAEQIIGCHDLTETLKRERNKYVEDHRPLRGKMIDFISLSAALVTLFQWIAQIARGTIQKGASNDDNIRFLVERVLDDQHIPQKAKVRLVDRAMEYWTTSHE